MKSISFNCPKSIKPDSILQLFFDHLNEENFNLSDFEIIGNTEPSFEGYGKWTFILINKEKNFSEQIIKNIKNMILQCMIEGIIIEASLDDVAVSYNRS